MPDTLPRLARYIASVLSAIAIAACASSASVLRDADPIDPAQGCVLLRLRGTMDTVHRVALTIALQRIEPDGSETGLPAVRVEDSSATFVQLPPGHYYLARVAESLPLQRQDTAFTVEAGRMNYPGDWRISLYDNRHGAKGMLSQNFVTEIDPSVEAFYRHRYPAMASKLPLRPAKDR